MSSKAGGARVALVTGASGITGRHCVHACLKRNEEWRVITLARRDLQLGGEGATDQVQQVKADLLDKGAVEAALRQAGAESVTHVFHCAYLMKKAPKEECEVNLSMLKNVVEAAEAAGAHLQHVFCMEGGKWYGQHLSTPLKTPHREDDPPIMPPMFYFDLQALYLEQRVEQGAPWTWSALRPNPVCGFSTGSFMNLSTSLAMYASICKEMGLPLRFPGTVDAWDSLVDVTDADLLAEGMLHCATTPACANQAFNICNGDCFRWKDMWPRFAEFFEMGTAPPVHTPLQVMADKGEVWAALVKKHGLQDTPYNQLATWQFVDFVFTYPASWFSTVNKLRRTGFHAMCIDSDAMFASLFQRLREEKVIP
ncbi:hypothetical protein CHLNCDRAFT_21968 [Chlorella variabilis]|uniref:PRISE-like Rossmann-fold domain-containing protein n=1 Tax=Chlorella variabilis TaxID=554065 RepID=E1ZBT7_CHLVA|nr:hypothetical protein CHLNCDRAFT_21968 [Chlorella variabilis]EFN56698.1 hypothetical protein CHLNCDRAFT_21968 [Chlorella variabilis]|eukprot:XP_005848800.1 hypothetical protein CHLNCDRAFT_21968 [Chlorella variabilis]